MHTEQNGQEYCVLYLNGCRFQFFFIVMGSRLSRLLILLSVRVILYIIVLCNQVPVQFINTVLNNKKKIITKDDYNRVQNQTCHPNPHQAIHADDHIEQFKNTQ